MKKTLLSIVLLLTFGALAAQDYEYPGLKQMRKGAYDAVQKDIDKHLAKTPDDVPYLFAAAKLYSTADYTGRDIPKAYKYIGNCKSKFMRLQPNDQDKLIAKGLTKELLNATTHEICAIALQDAEAINTAEVYNNFLKAYPRSVPSLQRQAKEHLSHLAFEEATTQNTISAYEMFVEQNPEGADVEEAIRRRNALAYEQAKATNSLTAFQTFINRYPEAEDIPDAWQHVYALALREAQAAGTHEALEQYINTYPDSPYARQQVAQQAADKYASYIREGDWLLLKSKTIKRRDNMDQRQIFSAIMQEARKRHSAPAALFAYQNAPNIDVQDTAWLILHDVYCNTGVVSDISKLYDLYPNPRFAALEAHDRKVVSQYNTVKTTDRGWESLINLAAPYRAAYTWMTDLIANYLNHDNIELSLETVRPFAEAFGDDPAYKNLINALEQGQQELIPMAFSDSINSQQKEYSPVITADGKTMYFVRMVYDKTMGYNEDIFTATRDANGWNKAYSMAELSIPGTNEAMQSVSADGTQLIFFRNGILFTSSKTPDGWSEPTPLPETINVSVWQSDAMITSDGRAMLFSAQKQVENEINPSVNIFVSLMDEYGAWGEPIDLGPNVNTAGLERKPFLHPDMKTLYFSSDGHGSLGDLDVFMTTRLRDDSWTEWSTPVNLGAQINSPRQEWGYKISTDGAIAYYSNGDDLYMLDLPQSMRPNAVATISGTVRDETGSTVGVTIRWEDLDTHEGIGQSQTDPSNGAFYLVLPLGKNYGYYIDDERYFPVSNNIDLSHETKNISIEKNILLTSYKQMIEEGLAVQVNNLFFPVNKWDLLPQSENELIRVASIIKERNIRVEISGHTDSTGDAKKNMVLSKQRADAVREFLIKQGCNGALLVAKGYGATRPIADNQTEEGKQQNRRVELQFLK